MISRWDRMEQVCWAIQLTPGIRFSEIRDRLGWTNSNLNNVTRELKERGWVTSIDGRYHVTDKFREEVLEDVANA